jgi:hypothetical protein
VKIDRLLQQFCGQKPDCRAFFTKYSHIHAGFK